MSAQRHTPLREWMSVPEAARSLGVSRQTVVNMCVEGRIPGAQAATWGRRTRWLVPRDAVPLPTDGQRRRARRNEDIRRRRERGESVADITAATGLGESRVREILAAGQGGGQ